MRRLVALGTLAISLTVSPCLRADSADEQAARGLFKEGLALHEQANYAAALEKFYAAYAKWKNPKILPNIGTAAWELGRFLEALNAYDQFLAEAPQDPSRADVEKAREEVLRKVGTLKVLHDSNTGALTVDGAPVPPEKLAQLRVNPGRHNVELKRSNGSRVAHGVDVAAGATVQVDLRQDQPRTIVLSQAPATSTTTSSLSLPPSKPADSGQASKPRRPIDPVPWIVGGAGVGALIASGVLWNMRSQAVDDLADDCIGSTCPDRSQDDIDSANRYGLFSAIGLGVGVACVGTATYLLLSGGSDEKKEPKGPTTQIGLAATPLGASGSVRVRF